MTVNAQLLHFNIFKLPLMRNGLWWTGDSSRLKLRSTASSSASPIKRWMVSSAVNFHWDPNTSGADSFGMPFCQSALSSFSALQGTRAVAVHVVIYCRFSPIRTYRRRNLLSCRKSARAIHPEETGNEGSCSGQIFPILGTSQMFSFRRSLSYSSIAKWR